MLQEMKNQIIANINKAKESGELTASQVYGISRDSIEKITDILEAGTNDLHGISKDTVSMTVQSLEDAGEASEEKISAALHGAIDGIKQAKSQMMDTTHKEIGQAKKRLREEEAKLAVELNEVFEGAKEAAGDFSKEVKADIETALTDVKLKSTEMLGITRDTVKVAVNHAIEAGTEVEDTVVNVTRDATSKALAEAHFNSERVRKITETVLSAAIEASEELGSHLSETASAAAEGVRQGLTDSVEHTRESVTKAGKGVKKYATEQLEQTKEDLDVVGEQFVESLRNVADKSGKVAQDTLYEMADDAKKAGSSLREKALAASTTVAAQLKELGSEALDKTEEVSNTAAEEAKELGDRMLAVAKGATTGMWEGAKSAFHKNDTKG